MGTDPNFCNPRNWGLSPNSLDLNDESGLDFLPDLISTYTSARVLVLTSSTDTEAHHQVIEAGAMGLVLKGEAAEVLIHAIEKVHAGEIWLTRSLTASVLSRLSRGSTDDAESTKIQSLTKREREIIALIAHGFKRSQIADSLFISEATVRNHLTSIFAKLELADRFELVFYAYRMGWPNNRGERAPNVKSLVRFLNRPRKPIHAGQAGLFVPVKIVLDSDALKPTTAVSIRTSAQKPLAAEPRCRG